MELNLQRRVAGLEDKMPDIQKTLETVRFLKTRTVRYEDTNHTARSRPRTEHLPTGRLRPHRHNLRAQRHTIRESFDTAHGRSVPLAWSMSTRPGTSRRKTDVLILGQCDVVIPDRRGRDAPGAEALCRKAKPVQLRGGPGLPERADHGTLKRLLRDLAETIMDGC